MNNLSFTKRKYKKWVSLTYSFCMVRIKFIDAQMFKSKQLSSNTIELNYEIRWKLLQKYKISMFCNCLFHWNNFFLLFAILLLWVLSLMFQWSVISKTVAFFDYSKIFVNWNWAAIGTCRPWTSLPRRSVVNATQTKLFCCRMTFTHIDLKLNANYIKRKYSI